MLTYIRTLSYSPVSRLRVFSLTFRVFLRVSPFFFLVAIQVLTLASQKHCLLVLVSPQSTSPDMLQPDKGELTLMSTPLLVNNVDSYVRC